MIKIGLTQKVSIPIDDIASLVCGIYAGYQSAHGEDPSPYLFYGPTIVRTSLVPPFMLFVRGSLKAALHITRDRPNRLPAQENAQMIRGLKEGKESITVRKTAGITVKEAGLSALETAVGYGIGYAIGKIS
ncbi:hypothetical protein KY346_02215 [Candidatus Woesearchaeota archaeon]|nr:hypothetical protein [Candidatus Woesearchaeota archaeon]